MPDPLHLLIPYAAWPPATPGQAAQQPPLPALPNLEALLQRMAPTATLQGAEDSFSPPHERLHARLLGLPDADGQIPWAAWARAQAGHADAADSAWAYLTPCLWQVGADHVTLAPPEQLQLDEAASRELLALLAPWFAEDGITLHYEQPTRWWAAGAVFDGLATAALDRVLRRDVRPWMPDARQARTLHRLHSEMQMLLYTHPYNDARAARGLPPVNAFWVHGAGRWQDAAQPGPTVDERLRAPALAGDARAWASAWQALDAGPLAALQAAAAQGQRVQITLGGERAAQTWASAPQPWWRRLAARWQGPRWPAVAAGL
ncbi:phosphoglycerate mutase [Acidovorax lacteus]|uniref:Phosphoglycerate mutase n=1 Tax=Acidovorax lacteus TaxID=1924988 RepID=A0ABP8LF29_9BURK